MLQTRGRSAGSNTREKNKKSTMMMKTMSTREKKEEVGTLFCLFLCSTTKQKRLFVFHAFPFFSWAGRRAGRERSLLFAFFSFFGNKRGVLCFALCLSLTLSLSHAFSEFCENTRAHSLTRSLAHAAPKLFISTG